jgi:hypothetical protein
MMGIRVPRMVAVCFLLGSGLAGVAGVFIGYKYGHLTPYSGFLPGVKGFVAAVIGGIGSFPGAVVGGIMGVPGGPVGMAVGAALGAAVGGASGEMVHDATEEINEERQLMHDAETRDRRAPAPDRGVAPTPPATPAGVPGAPESAVAGLTGPATDLSGRAGTPAPPAADARDLTGQSSATPYRGAGEAARSAQPGEIQVLPDTPGDRGIDWPEEDIPGDRGPQGTDTEYRSGGAGARGE